MIVGLQTGAAATETFTATDTIDGGTGTDTLRLTNTEAATANSATVTNVENLVYIGTGGGSDLDLASFTSVTNVTVSGTAGAQNIDGVALTDTLAITGATATADIMVTHAGVTGAADVATVTIDGALRCQTLDLMVRLRR